MWLPDRGVRRVRAKSFEKRGGTSRDFALAAQPIRRRPGQPGQDPDILVGALFWILLWQAALLPVAVILAVEQAEHVRPDADARWWPTGGPDFVSSNKTYHGDVDACPTKSFMVNEKDRFPREYDGLAVRSATKASPGSSSRCLRCAACRGP